MAYKYYNPNPVNNDTGDCVVRAISKALNQTWDEIYWDLCDQGYLMGDWGDSNRVWDTYLRENGFIRKVIPNTCPHCYTVEDFCHDNPYGIFILATGNHVVAVIDGIAYDSWNSLREVPIFYYVRQ